MSWIIEEGGQGRFTDELHRWQVEVDPAAPQAGVRIGRSALTTPAVAGDAGSAAGQVPASGLEAAVIRLLPPDGKLLPPLAEVYSRGDDLVALLPQTAETDFGLNVSYRIVRAAPELLVCETVVAIQTDLLDSHPTLDLVCESPGQAIAISGADNTAGDKAFLLSDSGRRATPSPPAVTRFTGTQSGATVLMLPPSDQAVAEDRSEQSAEPACYRLLAEFLEKGVIRKARYWVSCWSQEPSEAAIAELYRELLHIPLPLTP